MELSDLLLHQFSVFASAVFWFGGQDEERFHFAKIAAVAQHLTD